MREVRIDVNVGDASSYGPRFPLTDVYVVEREGPKLL